MDIRKSQQGVTLLVTLVSLVIVTLLALAAIKASSINLRISGNVQAASEAEAAAQFAIDGLVADINTFKNPPNQTVVPVRIGGRDYDVTLRIARCLNSKTAPGYSLLYSSPPVDQVWNLEAEANHARTGARATVTQGIRVRMPVGTLCPN